MSLWVPYDISDIASEQQFKDISPGGYRHMRETERKIEFYGDDGYITGHQQFKFSYKRNIGNDEFLNCDKFICNLIDPEWNTTVHNITFKITLPKEFDESQIKISVGENVLDPFSSNIEYRVQGNTITGSYSSYLQNYKNLNFTVTLPDGYFVQKQELRFGETGYLLTCALFILVSFILWYVFGRDKKPVVGIDFYPPEKMGALEAAYWFKGKLVPEDAICTLLELENKGYLKLDCNNNSYTITHLKKYDGNNISERALYHKIFENGKVLTKEQLSPFLNNAFQYTISTLRTGKIALQAYTPSSSWIKIVMFALFFIFLYITIGFSPLSELFRSSVVIPLFGIPIIIVSIMLAKKQFEKVTSKKLEESGFSTKTIVEYKNNAFRYLVRFSLSAVAVIFVLTIFKESIFSSTLAVMKSFEYLLLILSAAITFTAIILSFKYMEKRTPESFEKYEKLLSFRNFLETAEKEKIETLSQENPDYLKEMLPFAYALNISEKWSEKIQTSVSKMPDWYTEAQRIEMRNLAVSSGAANNIKQNFAEINTQKASAKSEGRTYKKQN
jgi:hypothetical protein